MTPQEAGILALIKVDSNYLSRKNERRNRRRSQSDFVSNGIIRFDAAKGVAFVATPEGGEVPVKPITTGGLSGAVGVQFSARGGLLGSVDAKPV